MTKKSGIEFNEAPEVIVTYKCKESGCSFTAEATISSLPAEVTEKIAELENVMRQHEQAVHGENNLSLQG